MNASKRQFELTVLPDEFAIVRLGPNAPVPTWAMRGAFFSVTRTSDELSIVCLAENVPPANNADVGWRALKVKGPFAFTEVGVLATLASPLAVAGLSLFTISTFDTDYLLVSGSQVHGAISALRSAGHQVEESSAAT